MTDIVKIAFISAVPGALGVVLGFINRGKITNVQMNVDGNLNEIKAQLAAVTKDRLDLTRSSAHAAGMKEEKDSHDSY